jgi:predicted phosphodiesterase
MMDNTDTTVKYINRIYRYIKNDMPVETFMAKFQCNKAELNGIMELCKLYRKDVCIEEVDGILVFKKNYIKGVTPSKLGINSPRLIHNQICVVSDTHFGNNLQQLHLLNEVYQEAYNRGITTVLHVGDIVDGNYLNRAENTRLLFLHNFDEQANYVVEMYPEISGITTYYILGSHDETHYKNGGATIDNFIAHSKRSDLVCLGQDFGRFYLDKVEYDMDHPGGGKNVSVSYALQKRVEVLESHHKPQVLLVGHYHGSYHMNYRNVEAIMVPALCGKTQFQQKKGLWNDVGAYFLDVYSDEKGNIVYFEAEEVLFDKKDMWEEAGKDKNKVKKLEIKDAKY